VRDDDEILGAYEGEFDGLVHRRSNRGFWMVTITVALGAIVLLVEIFANRPLVNDISRTEHDLRAALAVAERAFAGGGTFAAADAAGLASLDRSLRFVGSDEPSTGPGTVSVFASARVWAASVKARTGTCFYIKQVVGRDTAYLVDDGACTGREGLAADQDRW
jgi:hypothetical protein